MKPQRSFGPASLQTVGPLLVGLLVGGLMVVGTNGALAGVRHRSGPAWTVMTPAVRGAPITQLVGVTCLGTTDCWAVGDRFASSSSNSGPALIEHYSKGKWTTVAAAPALPKTLDQLSGVSCLSTTDCWAVGMRTSRHPGNLLEHYNGHKWTAVATPAPQGQLTAAACVPVLRQCWAVGQSSDFTSAITFHLADGAWHFVRAARLKTSFVQVNGVACASADDCLLVGFEMPAHSVGAALAERWDGKAWKRVAVVGQLSDGGSLGGVACLPGTRPTTCWAVGQTRKKGPGLVPIHPLVERWNGTSFQVVASPAGATGNFPELQAVACSSGLACQAVGSRGSGQDDARVLTEGWNGRIWSDEPSPSPLFGFQMLDGVSCPARRDCWAVGNGENRTGTGSRMIIEHYAVP